MVKRCEGLEEPPNHEEWKKASRVLLMDNELFNLPITLECHFPLTLLLQTNKNLRVILEFFLKSIYNIDR